jgi:hypothetical protein
MRCWHCCIEKRLLIDARYSEPQNDLAFAHRPVGDPGPVYSNSVDLGNADEKSQVRFAAADCG